MDLCRKVFQFTPDHGDDVQVDLPDKHEPEDADLDGNDGDDHPDGGRWIGNEEEGDDEHDDRSGEEATQSRTFDAEKLK